MGHAVISAARAKTHGWLTALAIAGVVTLLVAVIGVVAWFTVVPGVVANLNTRIAPADETVAVGEAAVPVPAGWAVQHPPFDDGTVVLISPDGGLGVTVTVEQVTPDAAVQALAGGAVRRTETLSSGLQAVHAGAAADALTIAVGEPGAERAVVFAAHAEGGDIAPYTRVLAQLIDGAALRGGVSP